MRQYRECRFLLPFHGFGHQLLRCSVGRRAVFVGVHVVGGFVVLVYSLGTVINANNSNNKTSLAITTTTNNYVHLILLSSCLLLSASRTLHVFSTLVYSTLIFLPTLASFPSSHRALLVIVGTAAAAVAVAFVVVVVPVDLFFLNTILISAMLPIPPSTHILFLFSFFSRLLCRTLLLLYFTSLICLRTHRSGRCLDHPFWTLWDTGTLHQAGFSMCSAQIGTCADTS